MSPSLLASGMPLFFFFSIFLKLSLSIVPKVYFLAFCNAVIFLFINGFLASSSKSLLVWSAFSEKSQMKIPRKCPRRYFLCLSVFSRSPTGEILPVKWFFLSMFFLVKSDWRDLGLASVLVKIHMLFFWIGTVSNPDLRLGLEQLPFPRKEMESYCFVTYSIDEDCR